VSVAVNSFSMPDAENIPGNILYTALQRPKLLRGGEWRLAMINHIVAVCCCIQAISQRNWRWLVLAALLFWPVQWLIRLLSKHDAQFFEVYRRAIRHPLIREPN